MFNNEQKTENYIKYKFSLEKIKEIVEKNYNDNLVLLEDSYVDSYSPVKVYCKKHNHYFFSKPNLLLQGSGNCQFCRHEKISKQQSMPLSRFLKKFKENYGDRLELIDVEKYYKNLSSKVKVKCKEHGEFETYAGHLYRNITDCKSCNGSRGEKIIADTLTELNIEFIREYTPPELSANGKVLEKLRNIYNTKVLNIRYDFYIPKRKLIIEFHGEQHFSFSERFYITMEEFQERVRIDILKKELAKVLGYIYVVFTHKDLERNILRNKLISSLRGLLVLD